MVNRLMNRKDLDEPLERFAICIGSDVRRYENVLHVNGNKKVFTCDLEDRGVVHPYIGGTVTREEIQLLRDFLTDILEGKA